MNLQRLNTQQQVKATHALALQKNNMQKTSFQTKLRSILSLKSIEEVVSWLPEGRIWRIHKTESFKTAVLPLFQEVSGWEAFLLVLCAHGFKEVSRGVDSVAFYNQVSWSQNKTNKQFELPRLPPLTIFLPHLYRTFHETTPPSPS